MMTTTTYLIIGASRGIGLEFVNQLLARENTYVYATVRHPETASLLETATFQHADRCRILKCDVADERSGEVGISCLSYKIWRRREGSVIWPECFIE